MRSAADDDAGRAPPDGFEREGLLRGDSIRDGQLMDALVMGHLREPLRRDAPA